MEFQEFPKIARLSRECVITEKIDGTNAQVFIAPLAELTYAGLTALAVREQDGDPFGMMAGSRTRYITPTEDNHGFAKWVQVNAETLWALGRAGTTANGGAQACSAATACRKARSVSACSMSPDGTPSEPSLTSASAPIRAFRRSIPNKLRPVAALCRSSTAASSEQRKSLA